MIIQCESCRTKFKLNEDLIKGKGARVRCKKCGDYIVVMKSGYEHLKNQYIESVKDSRIAEKESSEEVLVLEKKEREELPAEGMESPTEGEPVGEKEEEKEEEKEVRGTPSGEEELPKDDIDKAFEDFLGSIQEGSGSSLEGERTEFDTSTFDGEEAIGFSTEDEEITGKEGGDDLELSLEDEKIDFQHSSYLNESISSRQEEGEEAREDAVSSPKEEEELVIETPLSHQEPPSGDEEKAGEIPSETALESPRGEEAGDVKASPFEYISKETPGKRKSVKTKNFLVVVLILLLIIAGVGAYLAFTKEGNRVVIKYAPYLRSMLSGENHPSSKDFNITNLIGYNETNEKEGNIFVIKGDVVNLSKEVKSGLILKGEVMGKKGNLLGSKKVYGGNSLTPGELKTKDRAAIEKTLQNKLGKNLANIDIQPGSSIPFMIVFFDLQEKVGAYKVESME